MGVEGRCETEIRTKYDCVVYADMLAEILQVRSCAEKLSKCLF